MKKQSVSPELSRQQRTLSNLYFSITNKCYLTACTCRVGGKVSCLLWYCVAH